MSVVSFVFCVINVFLAIVSVVPCLMGGAMGMDSPQAQKDPTAIVICFLFLTFPIVSLVCGILPPILNHFKMPVIALLCGLWPWIEAISVILYMYCNEPN